MVLMKRSVCERYAGNKSSSSMRFKNSKEATYIILLSSSDSDTATSPGRVGREHKKKNRRINVYACGHYNAFPVAFDVDNLYTLSHILNAHYG